MKLRKENPFKMGGAGLRYLDGGAGCNNKGGGDITDCLVATKYGWKYQLLQEMTNWQ